MNERNISRNLEDEIIEDDDDIAVDRRTFLDDDGIDIYTKKSGEKTVEERIKTSRTTKIKHNNWNNVDYAEDLGTEKITINPHSCQYRSTYEDVEFEKQFQKIIENSKYKELLLGEDRIVINSQIINDIIIYCYPKMKQDYSMARIFVLVCEYCGVGLQAMWKRLSTYLQMQILEDLREISKLPDEMLNNNIKLF